MTTPEHIPKADIDAIVSRVQKRTILVNDPLSVRVRHHVGPTFTRITLKPDYSTMTTPEYVPDELDVKADIDSIMPRIQGKTLLVKDPSTELPCVNPAVLSMLRDCYDKTAFLPPSKTEIQIMTDIDPRYAMPYSEFVKQTYAFASKNFFLESFQSIGTTEINRKEIMPEIEFDKLVCIDSLQEENRQLRDLGSAYTAQIDELCRTIDILHASMALAGEVLELQQELNAGERNATLKEIGDICYYLQILSNYYMPTDDTIEALAGEAAGLHDKHDPNIVQVRTEYIIDLIKRDVVYRQTGVDVQGKFALGVFHIVRGLHTLCRLLGTDLVNVIAMNREKLIKRYPSGSFSTQESAAKADANPSTQPNPA